METNNTHKMNSHLLPHNQHGQHDRHDHSRLEQTLSQIDVLDELESLKENVPPNMIDSYGAHKLRILRTYSDVCLSAAAFDAFDRCGHEIDVFNDTTCMSDFEDFVDEDAEFEQREPNDPLYVMLDEMISHGIRVDENALNFAWADFEAMWVQQTRLSAFNVSDRMQAYRELRGWTRADVTLVTKHLWVLANDILQSFDIDKADVEGSNLLKSILRHGNRLFR